MGSYMGFDQFSIAEIKLCDGIFFLNASNKDKIFLRFTCKYSLSIRYKVSFGIERPGK